MQMSDSARNTKAQQNKVRFHNLLAYGIGDLYGGGAFTLIGIYMIYFLTNTVGLSATKAGLVFGLGRVWDAITDPIMGYISDHTNSKYGRRRVYFLIGMVPAALSILPMWIVPFSKTTNGYIVFFYYLLSYMLFNTVYTVLITPYSALNADMTSDYKMRSHLSGFRMAFSQLASLISGVVAPMILKKFDNPHDGYFYMALCFGIFYSFIWLIVFWGTFEREDLEKNSHRDFNFKEIINNFLTTLLNKSFRMHLGMYIFAFISLDAINSLLFFYLNHYLKVPDLKPVATAALFGSEVLVVAVYIYIANRIGKAKTFRIGLSIAILGFLNLLFLTPENANPLTVALFFAFIGIGFSAGNVMPFAILPEVIDVDELITSKDRAGTYAGFMTFFRKFSQGLIVLPLVGMSIDMIGYNPEIKTQSSFTASGFKYLLILIPILVNIVAIIFSMKYRVTPQNHSILKHEIDRLKNGGSKKDIKPETQKICEMLTGFPYEKLYDEKIIRRI